MRTLLSVDVLNSIGKLNAGKGDRNVGLNTDHFINPSEDLSVHVSFFCSLVCLLTELCQKTCL